MCSFTLVNLSQIRTRFKKFGGPLLNTFVGFSGDAILDADFDEIETDRLDAVDDAERLIGITVRLAFLHVAAIVNNINMHVSPFSTVFPALTPAVRRRTGRQRRKDFLNFASGKVLATSPFSSQPRRA